MPSTVKLERRSVETAQRKMTRRHGSPRVQRADVCQPLRGLHDRPLDEPIIGPEQRPFLEHLSGWNALRVHNAAHSGWAQFTGAYGWAR